MSFLSGLTFVFTLILTTYVFLVAKRLDQSRHVRTTPFPSKEELLQDSENWAAIDMLDDARINQPTGKRYLVTGASGNLGVYMVQILARRGEQHVYCLDILPLPLLLQGYKGVHFIKCDITSAASVNAAFDVARPDVVFHLCSAIRFWERLSFSHNLSVAVNVDGTRHVITALKRMSQSEKILLHCSTSAVQLTAPYFMRLGRNFKGYAATYTLSDDRSIPDHQMAPHSYAVTKTIADRLVRQENGEDGLKTGVVCFQTSMIMHVLSFVGTASARYDDSQP